MQQTNVPLKNAAVCGRQERRTGGSCRLLLEYFIGGSAMLKNAKFVRVVTVFVLALVCVSSAHAKGASTQKSKLLMVSAVTTADADSSGGEIAVVTSDNSFVQISVSLKTAISKGGAVFTFSQIKRGLKLTCKGNWDCGSNIFKAEYVFIGKTVSDSEVGDRVAAACQKIAKTGTSSRALSTIQPALPPQLELTNWSYSQAAGSSKVFGCVKNLTDRPMMQLTATVDYYTKDGKYIVSTTPQYLHGDYKDLRAGAECRFLIRTRWLEHEYPELPARCEVVFTCVNQGGLTTNPSKCSLDTQ